MPEPCGKVVHMHYFCGADIARDKLARRSKSGIKTLLNRALIAWYLKK